MRLCLLLLSFIGLFDSLALANWQKINEIDYTWGPFKIYRIALFSETGEYQAGIRPLMLSLEYAKPVEGRDFAMSIGRSWENLGINLPQSEALIDRLKKQFPNLKAGDKLSYIALQDHGYFVLNDTVLSEAFSREVNDAIVAIWLDPQTELSAELTLKKGEKSTASPAPPTLPADSQ